MHFFLLYVYHEEDTRYPSGLYVYYNPIKEKKMKEMFHATAHGTIIYKSFKESSLFFALYRVLIRCFPLETLIFRKGENEKLKQESSRSKAQ